MTESQEALACFLELLGFNCGSSSYKGLALLKTDIKDQQKDLPVPVISLASKGLNPPNEMLNLDVVHANAKKMSTGICRQLHK